MALSSQDIAQFRTALQDAVVRCSERCLYQSSKWYVLRPLALPAKDGIANVTPKGCRAAQRAPGDRRWRRIHCFLSDIHSQQ